MRSRIIGLSALWTVSVLLGGCEDPLEPGLQRTAVESQAAPPRSPNDPQSWPVSATRIDVSWPDISNETGWEIHRSTAGPEGVFSLLAQTEANVTTYSDVELLPLTEYCYRVRSFRVSGRKTTFAAFYATTCATTFGPPGAPSNLSVTPRLFGTVDVAWTSSSTNTDGFGIERGGSAEGPWERLPVRLAAWQLSYQDQGRTIEQLVCYRIIAINAYGETPSVADCTTPPANPGPLQASSPDERSISLSWGDNSRAEDGFEVQRAGDDFVWSVIATVPANTTSYVDRTVLANTRYWYQVRATKDGGFSLFSNTVSASAATAAPEAPGLTVSPGSSSSVNAYWGPASALTEGYRLERSVDNGAGWVTAATLTQDQYGFYDEGLRSEQQVCYRLIAFNRVGESPPSSVACTTPPAAPTNLVTVSIDEQTLEHQWTDNSGVEDGYELWLFFWDGWDGYYYPVYLGPDVTSYRTGISESVYAIAAVKDGGYSDWVYPVYEATAAARQSRTATRGRAPAGAQRTPPALNTPSQLFHLKPSKGANR
jgi:hypothetical protein